MRNSLVLFSFVVCLSIRGTRLTQSTVEVVQNTSFDCIPSKQNLSAVHSRQRRYIIFEKGSSLTMAASAVKTLIIGIQGLNLVNEQTIYYELPSSVSIPKVEAPIPKPVSTKQPQSHRSVVSHVRPGYTHYVIYKRDVDSPEKTADHDFDFQDVEGLFFQQLTKFAELYGYNGRHCIMRTICEARHFLYPRGQSLFHDVIRIILEFSMPAIRSNKKYFAASNIVNPKDCANLYGPHCRISFLDYFTAQIHGKFM